MVISGRMSELENLVFGGPRNAIQHQTAIVRERSEDPGVTGRPLTAVDRLLMLIVHTNHAILESAMEVM